MRAARCHPPLALHFFLLFPRPVIRDKRWIALMYVPPTLLALWNLDLLLFSNRMGILPPLRSLQLIPGRKMAPKAGE